MNCPFCNKEPIFIDTIGEIAKYQCVSQDHDFIEYTGSDMNLFRLTCYKDDMVFTGEFYCNYSKIVYYREGAAHSHLLYSEDKTTDKDDIYSLFKRILALQAFV